MEQSTEHGPMYDEEWGVDLSEVLRDGGGTDQAGTDTAEPAETAEADAPAETGTEDLPEQAQEVPGQSPGEPSGSDVFTLKHMGTEMQVDRQRATELAQMGLDYDRVRGQRDELRRQADELRQYQNDNRELVDFFQDLAKSSGMNPQQLMDEVRVNQYVQQFNVSKETARERVAREKAERKLQAREAGLPQALSPAEEKRQRMQRDIREFCREFPQVKPEEIDKTVWDGVRQGKSLKDAYQEFLFRRQGLEKDAEIQRLRSELAAQRQNRENRAKTIGSQRAGTLEDGRDKFLEAFLSDD